METAFHEEVRRRGIEGRCGYCGRRKRLSAIMTRTVTLPQGALVEKADICISCYQLGERYRRENFVPQQQAA